MRCPVCSAAVVISAAPGDPDIPAAPEEQAEPARAAAKPPTPAAMVSCIILPWVLLAPAALALLLLMQVGVGVLWASLGVALGGLCLILGQCVRWPEYVRISASLSLALLGHGLTLVSIPNDGSLLRANRLSPNLLEMIKTSNLQSNFTLDSKFSELRLDSPIGPLLSMSFFFPSKGDKIAIATTADGFLKEFFYPDKESSHTDFEPLASYRLKRIAYRTVVDDRRGLLWTASCEPADLRANRHGDQPLGRADLHVYDIPRAQGDRRVETAFLRPRNALPLDSDVIDLLMSSKGDALFFLARNGDKVQLGRIDAERQAVDRQISLPQEIRTLCLTPDGNALYAAGAGILCVIDPATLKTLRNLSVRADVRSIAADDNGCVYLAEQGQWKPLTHVDLKPETPTIHQWEPRMHGRIYLKMAPNQMCFLYVGTSSMISDYLEALLINERGRSLDTTPTVVAKEVSNPKKRIQGEFFLSPDGRFLVNRWGVVLLTPEETFGRAGSIHGGQFPPRR